MIFNLFALIGKTINFPILDLTGWRLPVFIILVIIAVILLVYIIYLLVHKEDQQQQDVQRVTEVAIEEDVKIDKKVVVEEIVVNNEEINDVEETKEEQQPVITKEVTKEPVVIIPPVASSKSLNDVDRLNYSVAAYLALAPEESLQRYYEIENYILAFDGVKKSSSWKYESYRYGIRALAKMTIQGKTIRIYFDLDPNDYIDSVYNITDESSKTKHQNTPVMLRIKGNRGLKHAKELIDIYFEKLDIKQGEVQPVVLTNTVTTKEELIEQGLIKVKKSTKGYDGTDLNE